MPINWNLLVLCFRFNGLHNLEYSPYDKDRKRDEKDRNQSIGRWSVCTNKLTKTAMTNNDQKMRHPLDSKNTFVLFQKLPMVLSG